MKEWWLKRTKLHLAFAQQPSQSHITRAWSSSPRREHAFERASKQLPRSSMFTSLDSFFKNLCWFVCQLRPSCIDKPPRFVAPAHFYLISPALLYSTSFLILYITTWKVHSFAFNLDWSRSKARCHSLFLPWKFPLNLARRIPLHSYRRASQYACPFKLESIHLIYNLLYGDATATNNRQSLTWLPESAFVSLIIPFK